MAEAHVTPDEEMLDENLLASLVQFDEALRAGRVPTNPDSALIGDAYADLTTAANCLLELEGALPRSRARGPERAREPVAMPRHIGRFEIEGFLGAGGFAIVYKARDHVLDRIVAVKIPRPHALASPDLRKRFVREAQAAGQLDHPHIVPIFEAGEDGELPYIAYAYCEGPTLAAWVKESGGPLPPTQAARLMIQLAGAVQYCHDRGILHRDIKPANVLLFPQSTPFDESFPFVARLSDLGLAKLTAGSFEETATDTVMGTPLYMSPEQADERHGEVGPACDIYALGAVLYYLLCGRPPFLAAGLMDALAQVIEREPIAPLELNPGVDVELNTICLSCLEKAPARRYGSAQALADDLRRYLLGEPIFARPATRAYRAWRWCRRKPLVAGLLAGIAIFGCGLMGSLIANAALSAAHQSELRQKNDDLSEMVRQLDESLLKTNEHRLVSEANEARVLRLLYAADLQLAAVAWQQQDFRSVGRLLSRHDATSRTHAQREFGWYYLNSKVTAPSRLIADVQQKVWYSTCSPNGKWLAVCGDHGSVQLFEVAADFRLARTLETNQTEVNSVAFSPDSELLASAGDDGRVGLWNLESGEHVRWLDVLPEVPVYGVAFLDDERLVACGRSPDLSVWNVASGKQVETLATPHPNRIEALAVSRDGQRLATAGTDGAVAIFRLGDAATEYSVVTESTYPMLVLQFTHDGKRLIGGGMEGVLRVYDITTGEWLQKIQRSEPIAALAISPTGQVACADRGGVITLLEVPLEAEAVPGESNLTWPTLRTWSGHENRIHGLAFSPSGDAVISGNYSGEVRCWPLETDGLDRRLAPTSETFHPHPHTICGGKEPHALYRVGAWGLEAWDARLDKPTATLIGDRQLNSCSYVAERHALLVGDEHGRLGLLRIDAPGEVEWFEAFANSFVVSSVAFAEGQRAIALSFEGELAVLDLVGGRVTARLANRNSFAVSPDERWLVTGRHTTNDMVVMSAETLQEVARLDGHQRPVRHIEFSRDGGKMASTSDDRTAVVWDTSTWEPMLSLLGSKTEIDSAAFSPDGETIAVGDRSGTISLWQARTGQKLFDLRQLDEGVMWLEFSSDGEALRALTGDLSVHLFSAPRGDFRPATRQDP
jgi:WD40 repeat protein/serine/threonine protein kinase